MKYFLLFLMLITISFIYSQAFPSKETRISNAERSYLVETYGQAKIAQSQNDKPNDQGIMILVAQNICGFYPKKMDDFWKQLELVRKYYIGELQLYLYVWQDNPLNLIIKNNDYQSFDRLVEIDNRFLNASPYDDSGQKKPTPIVTAVLNNKIDWVKHIIQLGGNFQSSDGVYPRNYSEPYSMNLLSIASSQIQEYLINIGIEKNGTIEPPYDSHCMDNDVNVRIEPTKEAKVLFKLQKGDKFQIIGNTFIKYAINTSKNYWVKIKINGTIGWIFGDYVYIYHE
jgi:hypothetical protein